MLRHSLEKAVASLLKHNAGTLATQTSSLAAVWPSSSQGLLLCQRSFSKNGASDYSRQYSGDANFTFAQLGGMFSDVPVVQDMLPTRRAFTLEWSAHGVQFMPRSLPPASPLPSLSPRNANKVTALSLNTKQTQMVNTVFDGRGSHAQPAVQLANKELAALHAAIASATSPQGSSLYSPFDLVDIGDHHSDSGLYAMVRTTEAPMEIMSSYDEHACCNIHAWPCIAKALCEMHTLVPKQRHGLCCRPTRSWSGAGSR